MINTVFSIVAIIIGLCYFVIKENLSGYILIYNGLSIFLLTLVIALGIYTTFPKEIDILIPLNALSSYYPGEISEEKDEETISIIAKSISQDVNSLREITKKMSTNFLYMQILTIGGLVCFGLSLVTLLLRG